MAGGETGALCAYMAFSGKTILQLCGGSGEGLKGNRAEMLMGIRWEFCGRRHEIVERRNADYGFDGILLG
mgnify:CR=1 FL=1